MVRIGFEGFDHVVLGCGLRTIRLARPTDPRQSDTRKAGKIGKALPFLGVCQQQNAYPSPIASGKEARAMFTSMTSRAS